MSAQSREAEAAAVARDVFGIRGEATALPGEFDLNFRIDGPQDVAILKISPLARASLLDLAAACIAHLEGVRLSAKVPQLLGRRAARSPTDPPHTHVVPVPFGDTADGAAHVACALAFVEGIPLAELRPKKPAVLHALGVLLAETGVAMADFAHPELDREFPWRLETAPQTIEKHLDLLSDPDAQRVATTMERARGWLGRLGQADSGLPEGIIHNDANDYNVMVSPSLEGTRLSGLIDFGDAARGWRVGDPAVAAAYAMMGLADPVEAACAIARGYSSVTPLRAEECRAFLPLAATRLCLSICIQSKQMQDQPNNEYLAVSQKPARDLLATLANTDWRIAEFRIRQACGLDPNPRQRAVAARMARRAGQTKPRRHPVIPKELLERTCILDLSVESLTLPHPDALDALADGTFEAWVSDEMAAHEALAGAGRYGEARFLYDAPQFAAEGNDGPESRTVHAGLDLFAPVGTPVFAPLSGTVVSVANNDRPLDYGPTVILRHPATTGGDGASDSADAFHTLYGHLDTATLTRLAPGDHVRSGDVIGHLGRASENGGWPPHLHFQVIALDPLAEPFATEHPSGDFPGVVLPRLRELWESVLPDPSRLAGLADPGSDSDPDSATHAPAAPAPCAAARRIRDQRNRHLAPSLSLSYREPIHVVRGLGSYLFDAEGRRFLDTVNNVAHVGHCNRRVADAVARQARVLATNTRYLHGEIVALAEELLARFPAPLEVVFLVCSGSEANELALRLARCHTGNDGVVALEGGYHGNTGALVEISPYKFDGPGGAGRSDRVAVAPMPGPYRGVHRRPPGPPGAQSDLAAEDELARRYAETVAAAARRLNAPGVAAFFAEPILSCAGQIEPPAGYLRAAYRHIRQAGGVCVADEVQTGFGRTGDAFWAYELQGVVPDIVTLGKPMGNGHPVAAVVTTREIAESFDNGMEYFNSFGGNPVSCAAARAVLAELRDRNLQEHAHTIGGRLKRELHLLAARRPLVGDVRGRGLFLGIEVVRDPATREPFPEACAYIVNRARETGVLLSSDGPDHNVLKIKPPMVFGDDEVTRLAETLDTVLAETALNLPS